MLQQRRLQTLFKRSSVTLCLLAYRGFPTSFQYTEQNSFSPILELCDDESETLPQVFWHKTVASLLREAAVSCLPDFCPGSGLKRAFARGEIRWILGTSLAADRKNIQLFLLLTLKSTNTWDYITPQSPLLHNFVQEYSIVKSLNWSSSPVEGE